MQIRNLLCVRGHSASSSNLLTAAAAAHFPWRRHRWLQDDLGGAAVSGQHRGRNRTAFGVKQITKSWRQMFRSMSENYCEISDDINAWV